VRVVDRLIAAEPAGAFEDGVAGRRTTLSAWNLASAGDRQQWSVVAGGGWDARRGGLPLKADLVRLRAAAPIATAGVESLRLDLSMARRCRAMVRWRGAPEATFAEPSASPATSLRVELAGRPAWAGIVHDLAVTLRGCKGGVLVGIALEGHAERLDDTFAQAWRITLGTDSRRALLLPPETERRWRLPEALPAGHLRLGLGVGGALGAANRVTIATTAAGRETALLEVPLEPADPATARWLDLDLQLTNLAAGSEILFRATSDSPWKGGAGVPALAEPRILTAADDPRPNVLLISVDTLRADHLSLYGYPRETSPHLAGRAASSGITFESVVAPAAWTLPSHVSMFSGFDALRHGVNHEATPAPDSLRFVAESFRDAGYETVAFTAGGYVSPEFGFARGFESFRARRPPKRSVEAARAELGQGLDEIVEWLADSHDQPFFAFFHTYEVHAPFWAREPYFERFGGRPEDVPLGYAFTSQDRDLGERVFVIPAADGKPLPDPDLEVIERLYDSGIAYLDAELERLFDGLAAANLTERTIVVLTSDHGELLGEHGLAGHGPAYDQVVMIPLVLWVPGVAGGRRIDEQVRLVDVAPTLLDLAGIEAGGALDGQSLRPLWEGGPDYEERPAWIHAGQFGVAMRVADRLKYVWHRAPWDRFGAGEELFDLRADPAERRDLSDSRSELLASARERTRAWLLETLPGLRVTLDNRSAETYELTLTSNQNWLSSITNFDCDDLGWRPPHGLLVRLAAGESCLLVLEHLRASDLLVEARSLQAEGGGAAAGLTLATGELPGSVLRLVAGAAWEPAADPGDGALALSVEWQREPAAAQADVRIDESLAEQLRALGYLE